MPRMKELSYTQLRKECDPTIFKFKTTKEVPPYSGILGQSRGIKAFEFGVNVDVKGYNIYIEGSNGIGKTIYAKKYLADFSKTKPVPDDWCYIYNFNNTNEPIALSLPAGEGKKFATEIDDFIVNLQMEIKTAFNNQDFEKEKEAVRKDLEEKRAKLIDKLNKDAAKLGFQIKNADTVYFLPMINGKVLSENEFNSLSPEIKEQFEKNSVEIQNETVEIMKKLRDLEAKAAEKLGSWQNNIATFAISMKINELKAKYKKYPKALEFLKDIQQDITQNLMSFAEACMPAAPNGMQNPVMQREKPWDKYRVNVVVDNSELKGAPVVSDSNPSFYNLFGKLEYENQFGMMHTDHMLIKPGLVHKANGGYLILQIRDLLQNPIIWDSFKKVLRTKKAYVDTLKDYQLNAVALAGLKPEPIPIKMKVVLVGSAAVYQQLMMCDEDFKKLFKVKVEFEDDAPRNDTSMNMIASYIHSFCEYEKLPHFNPGAVSKVIEYCSRQVENQTKVSTQLSDICEILSEACTWAKMDNAKVVTADYVRKAVRQRIERVNRYDQNLVEMIQNGTIMIDTQGEKVGQINGLSIMKIGDFCFGKPAKITANTYVGKTGIVNIEREVSMSGTSHSKGVMILSAFIGEKFAQKSPLTLSASLCFEQLYSGVDGDSASSTELYALLSSLSELPIKQSLAVTGSVNQKGEIQPIGGVTDKIEGFFHICKLRGLTGDQGVIIPHSNIKNLNLNDEVIQAVKDGNFHIYPVKTIDEGIEILTGVPAGRLNKDGKYTPGSVNYLVNEKLKAYSEWDKAQ